MRIAAISPKPRSLGFSFGPFDVGSAQPDVSLGRFHAVKPRIVIDAFGDPLLEVAPPEEPDGPFRIGAVLYDQAGSEVLRIVQNEWRAPIENWDVEVVGPRIILCHTSETTLRLRSEPPHLLVIEKLSMWYHGAKIDCDEGGDFRVQSPDGSIFCADAVEAVECEKAIVISQQGLAIGYRCKGGLRAPIIR